eukprot:gene17960-31674_t
MLRVFLLFLFSNTHTQAPQQPHDVKYDGDAEQAALLASAVSDVWLPANAAKVLARLQPQTATDLLLHSLTDVNGQFPPEEKSRYQVATTAAATGNNKAPCRLYSAAHDGRSQHAREDYTGTLARAFAKCCGGGHITWTEAERGRVKALPGRKADASNRDPNHLTSAELDGSVWFHALRQQRESLVPTFGDGTHASAM